MAALGLTLAAPPSFATETDWTGATSTDWFDGTNWSAGVPTSGDDAKIGATTPTTTVVDTAGAHAQGLYIGYSAAGSLTIQNGGTLSNTDGIIGLGSTGTVTVTGAGSSWTNSVSLSVGLGGTGTLTIENGGTVSDVSGTIAGPASAVTVDGAGSSWTNTGSLGVGLAGTDTLTIKNGGKVSSGTGFISAAAGSTGTVTVDGANSSWTNSDRLVVGFAGTGTLTIQNGGAVSSASGFLGFTAGSTGTVTVDGTGSSWTNSGVGIYGAGDLHVGFYGAGTLTIQNGGKVSSANGWIGANDFEASPVAGLTGTVTVDGAGSSWTNSGYLVVGNEGTGTLTIQNGGAVSSTSGVLGSAAGSTGTVTVDGASSSWTNSGDLYVGDLGTGTLTIQNGGKVSNATGWIGVGAGSTGTVTVDGANSSWTNSGDLYVGGMGTGTLTIRNGGKVSNATGWIGVGADSTGTVTVDGTGSSWTNSGDLSVGGMGTGTLTIRNGGNVSVTGSTVIAVDAGSTGTLNIGAASGQTAAAPGTLNTSSVMFGDGTGSIVFNHTASNYIFAPTISGAGAVIVEAGTTALTGANTYSGGTTITGGLVNFSNAGNFGTGNITLNGGGLQWATGTTTDISGKLNPLGTNGGTFDTNGNNVTLAAAMTGGGLTKAGSGTLTLTGANSYSGATTISAGTLQLGNGGAGGSILGSVTNNGTLAFNRSDSYSFAGVISGSGALEQNGTGTTILTADSSYTGATTVNGGELRVNGSLGNTAVAVNTGGTLSGTGSIAGAVTVNAGGTLSAGQSPGTLTLGALTLNAGSVSKFELNTPGVVGGATNDLVAVTGNLALGGTLNATAASAGYYRLFNYGGTLSGSFATVNAAGYSSANVLTNIPSQVNLALFNAGQQLQFWDGTDATGNGTVDGGSGTWNAANTNWTGQPGQAGINDQWRGSVAVFDGTAGTVTVAGTQSFDTLQFNAAGYTLNGGQLALGVAGGGTINVNGVTATINSAIVNGTGTALTVVGGGVLDLGAANTFSGGLTVNNATVNANASGALGSGAVTLAAGAINVAAATTQNVAGVTVNGGTLAVDGVIAASSGLAVNHGGTLSGTGTVGNVTVNGGGALAPGNIANPTGTLTITGNLAFQSGALYVVQVTPASAASTAVSGTATLTGGSVQAVFAPGSYLTKQYTILHANSLGGTVFDSISGNVPAGFTESLSYTSTDVILHLTGSLSGSGLNGNQQHVATTLNDFFNNGGALPPNFVSVFGLTGGKLGSGLSQLSGEAATGAQQGAFQLGGQFLNVMLDPFIDGRGGAGGGGALGFAPNRAALPDDIALAYAKAMKAPVYKAPAAFEQRWGVWGSAYGGYNKTSGDAVVGSNDVTARAGGVAAGLDYRLTQDSVIGVALAGGATSWGLADGLGGGRSDAFQAGIYGKTRSGPLYVAGAFALANHWMSTDRTALGDHLTADFNAQSYGGRIEGGYRIATPFAGITPYAALQAQSFRTPSYSETDLSGGGFGLAYNARSATDTRSELGARFDRAMMVAPDAALTLRSRLAWAHDWVSDPALTAVFQTLPGASFIVGGATPAKDTALVTAGADLHLARGITLSAKFDGEFAGRAQTYAGTGSLRYAW